MTTDTPAQKAARTRKARASLQKTLAIESPAASGFYVRSGDAVRPATRDEVLDAAAKFLVAPQLGATIGAPRDVAPIFRPLVCGRGFETFAVAFLTARHQIIAVEALFKGTVDGCTVYPREVVRRALDLNASALMLAHNHPSGVAEPSEADRSITLKLAKALALVEIRLLDHFVLTETAYCSLAERGWL